MNISSIHILLFKFTTFPIFYIQIWNEIYISCIQEEVLLVLLSLLLLLTQSNIWQPYKPNIIRNSKKIKKKNWFAFKYQPYSKQIYFPFCLDYPFFSLPLKRKPFDRDPKSTRINENRKTEKKKKKRPYATPLNYETIVEISIPLTTLSGEFCRGGNGFSSTRKLRAPRGEISVSLSRGFPSGNASFETTFANRVGQLFSTRNSWLEVNLSREYLLI